MSDNAPPAEITTTRPPDEWDATEAMLDSMDRRIDAIVAKYGAAADMAVHEALEQIAQYIETRVHAGPDDKAWACDDIHRFILHRLHSGNSADSDRPPRCRPSRAVADARGRRQRMRRASASAR